MRLSLESRLALTAGVCALLGVGVLGALNLRRETRAHHRVERLTAERHRAERALAAWARVRERELDALQAGVVREFGRPPPGSPSRSTTSGESTGPSTARCGRSPRTAPCEARRCSPVRARSSPRPTGSPPPRGALPRSRSAPWRSRRCGSPPATGRTASPAERLDRARGAAERVGGRAPGDALRGGGVRRGVAGRALDSTRRTELVTIALTRVGAGDLDVQGCARAATTPSERSWRPSTSRSRSSPCRAPGSTTSSGSPTGRSSRGGWRTR